VANGTIKKLVGDRGFGFIQTEDGSDIFFHRSQVEGDAFTAPYSAPSAGPPPWHLYRFTFHTAFGVASEEPRGATRWRFDR